jgi:hypothetical protein
MVDRLKRLYSVLKASVLEALRFGKRSLSSSMRTWEAGKQETAGASRSPHPWVPAPRSRWAYSSVGLEHTPDKREVGSSNLPRPTT